MKWQALPNLQAGDIVLVKRKVTGWREWREWIVSHLIRVFSTTGADTEKTEIDHAALVNRARMRFIVCHKEMTRRNAVVCLTAELGEALGKPGFVFTDIRDRFEDTDKFEVAIFRRRGLQANDRMQVRKGLRHLHGKKYGHAKVGAHALDFALTLLWRGMGASSDVYLFRRAARMDDYPMCSWSVTYIFADWIGLPFDVPTWAASPDDLWDEILEHLGTRYDLVFATSELELMCEATNR